MKRKGLLLVALTLTASVASAQFVGPTAQGTTTNPNGITSVKAAQDLRDDTKVTMEGNIVQSMGHEKYLFKDATGEIMIEIDDDDWYGLKVTPEDTVIIKGEVDRHTFKPTDIDVDYIILKK